MLLLMHVPLMHANFLFFAGTTSSKTATGLSPEQLDKIAANREAALARKRERAKHLENASVLKER